LLGRRSGNELNKTTSFPNRDLNMDHFSVRSKNLFQDIFSDVGIKATNEYLKTKTDKSQQKLKDE
jgi:hypothetical protein